MTAVIDTRSDEELLVVTPRDAEAFGVFYDRHVLDIVGYFAPRVGSDIALDLAAETFAQALRSVGGFRSSAGSARQWLYGIARNQWLQFVRKNEVSRRYLHQLGIQMAYDDHSLERVDELVDIGARVDALRAAVGRLPAGMAEALRLRIMQGRDFEEVAALLGCSPGAARVRVSRGLSQLATEVTYVP